MYLYWCKPVNGRMPNYSATLFESADEAIALLERFKARQTYPNQWALPDNSWQININEVGIQLPGCNPVYHSSGLARLAENRPDVQALVERILEMRRISKELYPQCFPHIDAGEWPKIFDYQSKIAYESAAAAESDAVKLSDRRLRVYECPHCGGWHLTSK